MTNTIRQYNAKTIEVLTGLEPVRRHPGMYTDTSCPNHIAQEAIDNSVDEALAGYATHITVIHGNDGSIEVIDNGRGMPIDIHPEHNVTGVELILTKLHAGAKFSRKNYRFSGGLHGVGISVANALALRMIVTVRKNKTVYQMHFEHGKKASNLKIIGKASKNETGTSIKFWPDSHYFDQVTFSMTALKHLLRAKAVLCAGLKITLVDEATSESFDWHYRGGLKDYLTSNLPLSTYLPNPPFVGCFEADTETADWAVAWHVDPDTPSKNYVNESYVNLIPTTQGGTHVNGLRNGLLNAMRDFCEIHKLLPRGIKLVGDDLWENCHYVLSVKLEDVQFAGQTKAKLSSRKCAAFVSGVVQDAFSLWLNQNLKPAKVLAQVVIDHAQTRLNTAKKVVRKKAVAGPALPGKLSDCTHSDPLQCELFIVEGDSAGGSTKQGRNKEFQAVLPLRGKILNTWELNTNAILHSQEIQDIATAIGVEPGSSQLAKLRYGKICFLADADSDGNHITTLLCALFLRHFRPLVERGHVYVAMPPLYRIDSGKTVFYALDDTEKVGLLDRIQAEKKTADIHIQRFKGLGEMNPIQLRETTLAPDTRRLVQLTIEDGQATQNLMDMLLAKKRTKDRKNWLEKKGNLATAWQDIRTAE